MCIYEKCPFLESAHFIMRAVEDSDIEELIKVYSDRNALPFFNSDNCHGDNFYYSTPEKMAKAMEFWKYSYENGWFARMSIIDKSVSEVIGTVELCLRVSDDAFNNMAVMRIDVRSDYESADALREIFMLITPHISDLTGTEAVITKIPIYAVERICAATDAGYAKSETLLHGNNGFMYDGYWTKNLTDVR